MNHPQESCVSVSKWVSIVSDIKLYKLNNKVLGITVPQYIPVTKMLIQLKDFDFREHLQRSWEINIKKQTTWLVKCQVAKPTKKW